MWWLHRKKKGRWWRYIKNPTSLLSNGRPRGLCYDSNLPSAYDWLPSDSWNPISDIVLESFSYFSFKYRSPITNEWNLPCRRCPLFLLTKINHPFIPEMRFTDGLFSVRGTAMRCVCWASNNMLGYQRHNECTILTSSWCKVCSYHHKKMFPVCNSPVALYDADTWKLLFVATRAITI